MLFLHMFLPVVFSSEPPHLKVSILWLQGVTAPLMTAEVLNSVVVNAVDMSFKIFGGWKPFPAFFAPRWPSVILFVAT